MNEWLQSVYKLLSKLAFSDIFIRTIIRLYEWKDNVENRGMKINLNKTKEKWRMSEANA